MAEAAALLPRGTAGIEQRRLVPAKFSDNAELAECIRTALPENYNFEILKTLWRLEEAEAKHVALQFPEGLLQWAQAIAAILRHFLPALEEVTILGDVTYGACCIDDATAASVGADFLVHYGHSCLVPLRETPLVNGCLYVFVSIAFDVEPLIAVVERCFCRAEKGLLDGDDLLDGVPEKVRSLALLGTIQYSGVLAEARRRLVEQCFDGDEAAVLVPQQLPLTPGEVLGCTSPLISAESADIVVFVADGRFHLESTLIQNPHLPLFRYDPFTKRVTRERYDHARLHVQRQAAVAAARAAQSVGLILGTLGRQGSVGIFERLTSLLDARGVEYTLYLMSEILPSRLAQHDVYVQVACPRLSIDWGAQLPKPLLTPYEACCAFDSSQDYNTEVYPMDNYSYNGGQWSNYKQTHRCGSLAPPESSLDNVERRRRLIRARLARAAAREEGS